MNIAGLLTDHTIVFMQRDGEWQLTPGSRDQLERSVLFDKGMFDALEKDFLQRVASQDQDEIIVACTHASYTLVKPR